MDEQTIKNIEEADYDIIESVIVSLRELWRKRLFIILVTIAGFLLSIIVISIKGNSVKYYSSATLFSMVYGSTADASQGVAAMNKYAELIKSSRVCGRAAQALTDYNFTTSDLQGMVEDGSITITGASTKSASYGIKLVLSVYSDSVETVLPLTNVMANSFAAEINELLGVDMIQVMDEATKYAQFNTINTTKYMLVFSGGAFVVSCGIIFLLAFFSPCARSVAQCEQNTDLILGILPYSKNKQ